jgi:hypothetical protein
LDYALCSDIIEKDINGGPKNPTIMLGETKTHIGKEDAIDYETNIGN